MATFNISRVTALPGTLLADTIYLVSTGVDKVEMYVTGNTATARRVLNQADIQALIDASLAGVSALEVVADIAARNALVLTKNTQVLVINATGDATVASGAATYVWRQSNSTWTKISEAESLDVAMTWASLTGKPASSVAAIDAAVANSHTHANLSQLGLIGQNAGGDITYNGREYVRSGTSAW
jgi:hypothetical protein